MGLLDPFRRFFHRMAESDELRYAEEIRAWAQSVPGSENSPQHFRISSYLLAYHEEG